MVPAANKAKCLSSVNHTTKSNSTNKIKAKINKTQENSECRMCGKDEESVNHVLSKCSKLAQKEYKRLVWNKDPLENIENMR